MSLHYDEKGKFFTDYISKDAVEAVIQTTTNRIKGFLYIRSGERVSDYLNKSGTFLPITDAEIFDVNGSSRLYRTSFVAVNMDLVIWVMPQDRVDTENQQSEKAESQAS